MSRQRCYHKLHRKTPRSKHLQELHRDRHTEEQRSHSTYTIMSAQFKQTFQNHFFEAPAARDRIFVTNAA